MKLQSEHDFALQLLNGNTFTLDNKVFLWDNAFIVEEPESFHIMTFSDFKLYKDVVLDETENDKSFYSL